MFTDSQACPWEQKGPLYQFLFICIKWTLQGKSKMGNYLKFTKATSHSADILVSNINSKGRFIIHKNFKLLCRMLGQCAGTSHWKIHKKVGCLDPFPLCCLRSGQTSTLSYWLEGWLAELFNPLQSDSVLKAAV